MYLKYALLVKSILLFGHWHKLEQTKTCDRNHFMTCLHQFHQIISKSKQINWNHESPIPETITTTNHREILHRYACIFKLTSKEQHNNVAILTTLILRNLNVRWQRHFHKHPLFLCFKSKIRWHLPLLLQGLLLLLKSAKRSLNHLPLFWVGLNWFFWLRQTLVNHLLMGKALLLWCR